LNVKIKMTVMTSFQFQIFDLQIEIIRPRLFRRKLRNFNKFSDFRYLLKKKFFLRSELIHLYQ
jgi:hypothetical protein